MSIVQKVSGRLSKTRSSGSRLPGLHTPEKIKLVLFSRPRTVLQANVPMLLHWYIDLEHAAYDRRMGTSRKIR